MGEFEMLGARLKELRAQQNMNQKEFAQVLGLTPTTITSYEVGKVNPSLGALKAISERFNVSIDWLCGLSDVQSIGRVPSTYKEIAEMFVLMAQSEIDYITNAKKTSGDPPFFVCDTKITDFQNAWVQILHLYNSGSITKETYNNLVDGLLDSMNEPIERVKGREVEEIQSIFGLPPIERRSRELERADEPEPEGSAE